MKHKKMTLLLPALIAGMAVSAQYRYTIKGRIANVPSVRYAYIAKNWKEMNVQDSVLVKNGSFTYTGTSSTAEPAMAFLFIGCEKQPGRYKKEMVADFYIDSGTVTLQVKGLGFRDSAIIGGTAANRDYRLFMKQRSQQDSIMRVYLDSLHTAQTPRAVVLQLSNARWKQFYVNFIQQHRSSFLSLQLLGADLWKLDRPGHIDTLLHTLHARLQGTPTANTLRELLAAAYRVKTGMLAPEFTEKDTSGVPVALSSFRGKYVLVDFWASWCHPCRAENPALIAAYEKFKGHNFTMLSVSLDKSKQAWLKAVHEDALPWQHLSALDPEASESVYKYGIKTIPRNFLIDPSGKIVAMDLRGEAIQEKLKEILN